MKIHIYQLLERLFAALEICASMARERVAICPSCGENRYTGKACIQ